MNSDQVTTLLARLGDAYPAAKPLSEDGVRTYRRFLYGLSYEIGMETIDRTTASCRYFPSIAELHEHAHFARERMRRSKMEIQTRAEREWEDSLERPALRDVPGILEAAGKRGEARAVRSFLETWDIGEPPPPLPETIIGKCDDCGQVGDRWTYPSGLSLCAADAARRLAAQAMIDEIGDKPSITAGTP